MATDIDDHRMDDDGAPVQHVYDWADIAGKADWEGSPDFLDWYAPAEIPKEGRVLWAKAKRQKAALDDTLRQIDDFFPEV